MNLSLTAKQIRDLNRMNKASQNVQLGTLLNDLIENGGGSSGGAEPAVVQKKTYLEFPNIGDEGVLYIDSTENNSYRWDNENKKYYLVGFNYGNIKKILGGNANG